MKLLIVLAIGCTLLFSYAKLYAQVNENVRLLSFEASECQQEPNLFLIQKRIVSKAWKGDTLCMEVATWDNCNMNGSGAIAFVNDTLKLEHKPQLYPEKNEAGEITGWYSEVADCDCCFHLVYAIAGLKKDAVAVTVNGALIEEKSTRYAEPDYLILNGDTLFKSDQKGYMYLYSFYESGALKHTKQRKGSHWIDYEYYENGSLKARYEMKGDIDSTIVHEYDSTGTLINYQNPYSSEP